MSTVSAPAAELAAVVRREWAAIVASLTRRFGDLGLAEDAAQDAAAAALADWPEHGVPRNPAAWLQTTAVHKVLDRLRRDATLARKVAELAVELDTAPGTTGSLQPGATTIADDRLRLLFMCCHPALAADAQVALTLREVAGLSTREIARAFVTSETTMAQRLVRAKAKIRTSRIPFRVPAADDLPGRLRAVHACLYLVFNEGYSATGGDALLRRELCEEAIRLGRVVTSLMPGDAEGDGLLALMLLQHARRDARTDDAGRLVLLADQDRSRWRRDEIDEGLALVDAALARRRPGPYQVQAAIAAVHDSAGDEASTDWTEIAALYGVLSDMTGSPVVELNRAVAVSMAQGPDAGLGMLSELEGALARYHPFHVARADMLRKLGRNAEAVAAYRTAIALVTNPIERAFLEDLAGR